MTVYAAGLLEHQPDYGGVPLIWPDWRWQREVGVQHPFQRTQQPAALNSTAALAQQAQYQAEARADNLLRRVMVRTALRILVESCPGWRDGLTQSAV